MKRTRLTYFTLIIGAVGLLLLAYVLWQNQDENSTNDIKGENEQREQSKYAGVDIVTNTVDDQTYRMAIHYPQFQVEDLNAAITQYVKESRQKFLDELNNWDQELLKERPATYYLSFKIYPVISDIYSIVFSEESYFGGANANNRTKIFLVDVKNDQFIQQKEIFHDTAENRKKLFNLLLNKFTQSKEYKDYFFEQDLQQWIDNEDQQFSNMYLTEDAIVFLFNKYEVTAGVVGAPEISIPFSEAKELLATEWQDKLAIPSHDEESESPQPEQNQVEEEGDQEESTIDPPSNEKQVALTFDDGPHPQNTIKILELLEEYDAKATFFMLGNRVDFYPEIAKQVAQAGHEIGNHTWDHKDLTALSEAEIIEEVESANHIIQSATGQPATVFRPPYGAINDHVKQLLNMPPVLWTIDTLDWKTHDPDAVLNEVKENVKDGSIILMHDIHETTVEAVRLVLQYLQEEGYSCVTVSQLQGN